MRTIVHRYRSFLSVSLIVALSLTTYSCLTTIRLFIENDKLMGILPLRDGQVYYADKVSVPGIDKAELFKRARRWWINKYRSPKDVFQLTDNQTGEIVGKGIITASYVEKNKSLVYRSLFMLYHQMTVDIKDGRYLVSISGIQVDESPLINNILLPVPATAKKADRMMPIEEFNYGNEKQIITMFTLADRRIAELLTDFNRHMKTAPEDF